jgi:hypothetical protein
VLGLPLIWNWSIFFLFCFSNDFAFAEFCSMCYFEFLNSVLIKNVEMDSSFLYNFYFNFFQNFKFFKFDRPGFKKLVKPTPTDFSGFRENRPVFERFFNPCPQLHLHARLRLMGGRSSIDMLLRCGVAPA